MDVSDASALAIATGEYALNPLPLLQMIPA